MTETPKIQNLPERRWCFEVAATRGFSTHKEQLCQLTEEKAKVNDSLEKKITLLLVDRAKDMNPQDHNLQTKPSNIN